MINKIFDFVSNIFSRITGKKPELKAVQVEDFPETYKRGVIYIIGEDEPWYAAMKCPCGCGEVIRLCLQEEVRPSWKLSHHDNGTISLRPSVWRTSGCRSHFFLRHGNVDWCKNFVS